MTRLLVVSDSSSLILGVKAGLLDLICKEFIVEIPRKVFEESVVSGKASGKVDAFIIENAVEDGAIIVKDVRKSVGKIGKWLKEFNLGSGEADSILLYIQSNAKLLLTDDKQAINAAKIVGVAWTTLPDLILEFASRKKIDCESALDALKIVQEEGRYKINFILEAFRKIEEMKGGKK